VNTAVKTILGIALLGVVAVALLIGGGLITAHLAGAGAMDADGNGEAGFEFGGYLILILVNVGLATVVAWMLFGKRE